nr:hypothetical protein [Candidatus Sigynarchaeota archaeon]
MESINSAELAFKLASAYGRWIKNNRNKKFYDEFGVVAGEVLNASPKHIAHIIIAAVIEKDADPIWLKRKITMRLKHEFLPIPMLLEDEDVEEVAKNKQVYKVDLKDNELRKRFLKDLELMVHEFENFVKNYFKNMQFSNVGANYKEAAEHIQKLLDKWQ